MTPRAWLEKKEREGRDAEQAATLAVARSAKNASWANGLGFALVRRTWAMSSFDVTALSIVVYRIVTVLVGLALAWMGYRLFLSGLFEKAGGYRLPRA